MNSVTNSRWARIFTNERNLVFIRYLPRRCQITGKRPLRARNISHAHNVTNRWQRPNIQRKRIFVPEIGRFIRLKVTTRALRTISKLGLPRFLKKQGLTLKDVT